MAVLTMVESRMLTKTPNTTVTSIHQRELPPSTAAP